ncbi:hypothetical protein Pint_36403 [Pistacia integerrima]|uniref:Uncharacterized protein n=1 Tax=Pistacia integerrima TaxID=434235 RepID=A0ACC0Y050_9ROSI|nr:hypothetical protein Pint_36403 [Pistacia integerrima]
MEFKHFSHPHIPRLYVHCSGCESSFSGSAYSCAHCQYFLHEQCAKASRTLQNSTHSLHRLTLFPSTPYSAGSFSCNACGLPGTAFSFCCALCEFDLHVDCALSPQTVKHEAHPHELSLSFALPHLEARPHNCPCGICHKVLDFNLWTYNCNGCNFHVHASCASNKIRDRKPFHTEHTSFVNELAMHHNPGLFHYRDNIISSGYPSKINSLSK